MGGFFTLHTRAVALFSVSDLNLNNYLPASILSVEKVFLNSPISYFCEKYVNKLLITDYNLVV